MPTSITGQGISIYPAPDDALSSTSKNPVQNKVIDEELTDAKNAISQKQDAPSSAGTAGQVLGLDSNLNPAWVDQAGGGDAATEKLLASIIPDTTQTITFNANGKPYSIVHASSGTTVRTDMFTWSDGSVTEVRTLSTGETLTIFTNLTTLAQTISAVTN